MCKHMNSGDFVTMTDYLPQDAVVVITGEKKYYYSRFYDRIYTDSVACEDDDCPVRIRPYYKIIQSSMRNIVIEPVNKTIYLDDMYEAECAKNIDILKAELKEEKSTAYEMFMEIKTLIALLSKLRKAYYFESSHPLESKDKLDESFQRVNQYLKSHGYYSGDYCKKVEVYEKEN